MKDKILVISRYHSDDGNPIYNAYIKGISQVREIVFIDYFNEYALRGKKEFEKYVKNILIKQNINEIFFLFVSGDVTLGLDFIYEISQNRFTYMVFWDLEQHFEIIDRYYAQCADLVLLASNDMSELFKMYDIEALWTFSLFDKDKYVLNLQRDIDVSFIGDLNKGNRKEYVKYLQDNGINIEVYGAGSKNGKVSFNKMIEILNRSKISINFSDIFKSDRYSFYKNINSRIKQTKGRVVEVPMTGAFLLTENSYSLDKLYDTNNIDFFSSKEELLEKIKYYLKNKQERITKAKKAQKEVIEKYDSGILGKILNTQKKPKVKYIYKDKEFNKVYGTFRWFYFLEYLTRFQFKKSCIELKEVFKNGIYLRESLFYLKHIQIIKKLKAYFKIKQKIKNIDKVVIYPSGFRSELFVKLFDLEGKVEFVIDDRKANIEKAKDKLVLITNNIYSKKLSKKLDEKNIKYINPFEGLDSNMLNNLLNFDVFQIFGKMR